MIWSSYTVVLFLDIADISKIKKNDSLDFIIYEYLKLLQGHWFTLYSCFQALCPLKML